MMFWLKKEFAAKQPDQQPSQTRYRAKQQTAKLAFPFYEDLTMANFR